MRKKLALLLVLAVGIGKSQIVAATALYEEVFANLGIGDTGTPPNGRLVQAKDGNFYGTCQQGGVKQGGVAFRLTPAGQLSAFYPFDLSPSEVGTRPHAGFAIGADGNLYGSTTELSGNGGGTVFRMMLSGRTTVLRFNDRSLLWTPTSYTQFLRAADGSFYAGLYDLDTQTESLVGLIQRLNADGTIVFSTQMNRTAHGAEPKARLTQGGDGYIYGTASEGGSNNMGTIFRVTSTGAINLVHSFSGADGSKPESSLVKASDGSFYGTTTRGGTSDMGTVFRLTPNGLLTTLVSFTGANGSYPTGGLTAGANGLLYGTTNTGGTANDGTFYRFTLQGVLTTLASFSSATTGRIPSNGVTFGRDGNFYGTTISGGEDSVSGTAYRATSQGILTKLGSFGDREGYLPDHGIIQGHDGKFYGVTGTGGLNQVGTIFQITPKGKLSTVAALDSQTTGSSPTPIVQGADGYLYGATGNGGANDLGAIFRASLSGELSVVSPLNSTIGYHARDFLRGRDGNFYGLAAAGGPNGGTIFRLTSAGTLSRFAALSVTASDSYFQFGQDADRSFYGTGVAFDPSGCAFKVDATTAQTTVLATFSSFDKGEQPSGGLARGLDGNFYGTTLSGGVGNGTIFRLTPAGVLSVVHTFTPTEANGSASRLLRNGDGSFFGTTFQNDNNGAAGILFRVTTDGVFQKWPVFNGRGGSFANGGLILASDGYIYGTTRRGGTVDGGVVYRFTTSPPQLTGFSPASGEPGAAVVLKGHYLAGISSVSFNGTRATTFTIDSSVQITATVPVGATTGPITIQNRLGTASTDTFTVL
jgi:uncharacterized repeat protein (TIGR03803 family)